MRSFSKFRSVITSDVEAEAMRRFPATIYALVDPRDGTARYIGQTRAPSARLRGHLRSPPNDAVARWFAELAAEGSTPSMRAIVRVPAREADFAERYWIQFYRSVGDLYNVDGGGTQARGACSRCGSGMTCQRCKAIAQAERRRRVGVEEDEWGWNARAEKNDTTS